MSLQQPQRQSLESLFQAAEQASEDAKATDAVESAMDQIKGAFGYRKLTINDMHRRLDQYVKKYGQNLPVQRRSRTVKSQGLDPQRCQAKQLISTIWKFLQGST